MARRRAFKVVVADPPWRFGDALPGPGRGASKHYGTLSVDEIRGFLEETGERVSKNALLFLWRVAAMPQAALDVVWSWGFVPKTEIVWVKTTRQDVAARSGTFEGHLHFGMGRYVRAAHETCIVAARGRGAQLVLDRSVRSVFFAKRGRHSEKPKEFYDLVERLAPGGPFLELFARRKREGWTCLGDEVEKGAARPLSSDSRVDSGG